MSEEKSESVGHVQVSVTQAAVTKAVRNILANEMNLDPAQVKNEVRKKAEELIQTQVLAYLKGNAYDQANLMKRIEHVIEYNIKGDVLRNMVKEVVTTLVTKHIREEVEGVVCALVKDTVEVRVGWDKKVPVKVSRVEKPDAS